MGGEYGVGGAVREPQGAACRRAAPGPVRAGLLPLGGRTTAHGRRPRAGESRTAGRLRPGRHGRHGRHGRRRVERWKLWKLWKQRTARRHVHQPSGHRCCGPSDGTHGPDDLTTERTRRPLADGPYHPVDGAAQGDAGDRGGPSGRRCGRGTDDGPGADNGRRGALTAGQKGAVTAGRGGPGGGRGARQVRSGAWSPGSRRAPAACDRGLVRPPRRLARHDADRSFDPPYRPTGEPRGARRVTGRDRGRRCHQHSGRRMRLPLTEESQREQPADQQRQLQRAPPGRRTHHAQCGTGRGQCCWQGHDWKSLRTAERGAVKPGPG